LIQVTQHVGPFQVQAFLGQAILQGFAQHQGQERAEHVAADRLVALVIDRSRLQQALERSEDRLDHPEVFVPQRDLSGFGLVPVGAKHPLAVEALLVAHLFLVDLEASAM